MRSFAAISIFPIGISVNISPLSLNIIPTRTWFRTFLVIVSVEVPAHRLQLILTEHQSELPLAEMLLCGSTFVLTSTTSSVGCCWFGSRIWYRSIRYPFSLRSVAGLMKWHQTDCRLLLVSLFMNLVVAMVLVMCYLLKLFLVVMLVAALTAPSVSSTRTNLSSRPSPIDARSGSSVT